MGKIYQGNKEVSRIQHNGQTLYPDPIRNGLVLWYDFKDGQNVGSKRNVAEDLSGNDNHGTLTNVAYQTNSGYGDGLKFDGVDDELNAPPSNFGRGDFTMEIVVKAESTFRTGAPIFTKSDLQNAWQGRGFGITNISNPKAVYSSFWADGKNQLFPFHFFENYPIAHFIMIKKGNSILHYVNGALTANRSFASLETSPGENLPIRIGNWSSNNYYSARAYNRALTVDEITHNYKLEKERFGI